MGAYTEYLNQKLNFQQIEVERKKQLRRISQMRGNRDILVYAADLNCRTREIPITICYEDIISIKDQIEDLKQPNLDLIIETPGGQGEIAEDVVRLLRKRFNGLGVIIPGSAKSAGTIIAMAADEILMDQASSLGPIDAQMIQQGKQFSAEAFIMGLDKIKAEVSQTGQLNKAYVPMLSAISPGELQAAQNALDFAKKLVEDWLVAYKFKDWATHSSTGQPVTEEDRKQRAQEIADELCKHSKWKTHGRSIKIDDLEAMRLKISNYAANAKLHDAIHRYHVLMQMTFATSSIYKIFETPATQIYKFDVQQMQKLPPQFNPGKASNAKVEYKCPKCGNTTQIFAKFKKQDTVPPGEIPFPADNRFQCPHCGTISDLSKVRHDIESMTKKPIVT